MLTCAGAIRLNDRVQARLVLLGNVLELLLALSQRRDIAQQSQLLGCTVVELFVLIFEHGCELRHALRQMAEVGHNGLVQNLRMGELAPKQQALIINNE